MKNRILFALRAFKKDNISIDETIDFILNRFENVFKKIKKNFSGLKIGYPAIGAGLAGGDWKKISKIIDKELQGEDHTFVEFNK